MDVIEQKSFVHRGCRVTIAHWTDGGKLSIRAEIHQGKKLVCVLTRSGVMERAPKLLAGVHNAAIKWAEHHEVVSKQPGQPWPPGRGVTN